MATTSTTYTVLVTIDHSAGAPDCKKLEEHILQALEEGTREHAGVSAGCVNAFQGDIVGSLSPNVDVLKAKELHRSLREGN